MRKFRSIQWNSKVFTNSNLYLNKAPNKSCILKHRMILLTIINTKLSSGDIEIEEINSNTAKKYQLSGFLRIFTLLFPFFTCEHSKWEWRFPLPAGSRHKVWLNHPLITVICPIVSLQQHCRESSPTLTGRMTKEKEIVALMWSPTHIDVTPKAVRSQSWNDPCCLMPVTYLDTGCTNFMLTLAGGKVGDCLPAGSMWEFMDALLLNRMGPSTASQDQPQSSAHSCLCAQGKAS